MTESSPREMPVADLTGRMVITSDGHTLGDVADVVIDVDRWAVVALRVRLLTAATNELELKKPWFGSARITIPVEQVRGLSDTVVLRASFEQLKEIATPSA